MAQYKLIRVERSGGFTGKTFTIDRYELEAEEADQIQRLFDHSGLAEVPKGKRSEKSGPDQFTFTFVFVTGNRQRKVVFREPEIPADLRMLLGHLIQKTRKKTLGN